MAVWLIRCGYRGREEYKERFFEDNVVAIGYGLKRPVTDFATQQEVRNHPDVTARKDAGLAAGKLWRFAGRGDDPANPPLRTGDLALTPYTDAAGAKMFAIGAVTGDYRFTPPGVNYPHWRPVRWRHHIPLTDDLPAPVRQLLRFRSGFQRALRLDEADLRPFLT